MIEVLRAGLCDLVMDLGRPGWGALGVPAGGGAVVRFDDRAAAGEFIAALHRQAISYNLILADGLFYCLPRRKQGEVAYAPWLGALAWYEMAGGFPLASAAVSVRFAHAALLTIAQFDSALTPSAHTRFAAVSPMTPAG